MINAIVMASGLSKRMGSNKLLLEYKGTSIIEYILFELSKVNFNQVIVVSVYEEISKMASKYDFISVSNKKNHIGQSESIKLGILNSGVCDGYMFFVGDQPFIKAEEIKKIIDTFNKNKDCIVIPRSNEKKGNPVIFPCSKREELLNLKNDEKGKKVISNNDKIKYVDVPNDTLFDIDTKEDFEQLLLK